MLEYSPFHVGMDIRYDNKLLTILTIELNLNLVFVYESYSNKADQYKHSELVNAFRNRELTVEIKPGIQTAGVALTPAEQLEVRRRLAFCEPARQTVQPYKKEMLKQLIPEVAKLHNYEGRKVPSFKTVQRWYGQWEKANFDMVRVILESRSSRSKRLKKDIEDIVGSSIRTVYLTKRMSVRAVNEDISKRMAELGYLVNEVPDPKTIQSRINELDPREVVRAREGELALREFDRATFGHHPDYEFLARGEADVFHTNIGVLDSEGYYIGSLSIAFVLDVGTRAILGYSLMISRKKKELASFVLSALIHSVIKKNDDDYPYGGICYLYAQDNGPGYRDVNNKKFIEHVLNAILICLPSRKGWGKPFAEALVKSLRNILGAEVEGYLGKYNPKKFTEETLMSSARWTVEQIEEKIYNAFCYTYHHTPLDALKGKTSHQVWQEKSDKFPPVFLEDLPNPMDLRPVLLEKRSVDSVRGANVLYQFFHCKQLQDLIFDISGNRKACSVKLTLEVNYYDARAINVINPKNGVRIEVPNTQRPKKRISFYQLNAWRSGVQKKIETAAAIETEKRTKLRAQKNRCGPRTTIVPPNVSKEFWDSATKPGISPHELMPEHDKEAEEKNAIISGDVKKQKQQKTKPKASAPPPKSRYEKSNKDKKGPKGGKESGGIDEI